MKKAELKQLIAEAKVVQDQEIDTSGDSNKPSKGKKLDNFQVFVSVDGSDDPYQLGVPAKTEDEARSVAYEHIVNMPEGFRIFDIEDLEK